jgi:hypothetical protein
MELQNVGHSNLSMMEKSIEAIVENKIEDEEDG